MSIEKAYGHFFLVCDICSDTYPDANLHGLDTFQEAVSAKKEIGWKSKRVNGEWIDVCLECKEVER